MGDRLPSPWNFVKRLRELRTYFKAERVDEITRRYLVMNAFDGALAILSVVASAYFVGAEDPRLVVAIGLANCLAMAISGFTGTLMTEKAERIRRLRELEEVMLTSLRDSEFGRVSTLASVYAAFVDGAAPLAAGVIGLMPLIIAIFIPMRFEVAVYTSLAVTMATLFALGAFLGRISRSNMIFSGLKMVAIGCLTALLCSVMKAV